MRRSARPSSGAARHFLPAVRGEGTLLALRWLFGRHASPSVSILVHRHSASLSLRIARGEGARRAGEGRFSRSVRAQNELNQCLVRVETIRCFIRDDFSGACGHAPRARQRRGRWFERCGCLVRR